MPDTAQPPCQAGGYVSRADATWFKLGMPAPGLQ